MYFNNNNNNKLWTCSGKNVMFLFNKYIYNNNNNTCMGF